MTSAKLTTTNIKKSLFTGFTLIELLIVIAILGILAAVVLVAINPAEQLARARDAGRQSGISQLGHAIQSYFTTQQSLPTSASTGSGASSGSPVTWNFQNVLVGTSDIQNIITAPTSSTITECNPAPTTDVSVQGNYCYSADPSTNSFVVWTKLESNNSLTEAQCTGTNNYDVEVYSSSQGKAGIDCLSGSTAIPAGSDVLH